VRRGRALLLLAAPAAADDVVSATALGHLCRPSGDVRVCPTESLADRVPSFDGVPLDDLTRWKELLDAGRIDGAEAQRVLDNAFRHHGVGTLRGRPEPRRAAASSRTG
jgi:hypothetical protein